jgi:hypothetical protein
MEKRDGRLWPVVARERERELRRKARRETRRRMGVV